MQMPAQPLSGSLGRSLSAYGLLTAWPLSNYAALSWTLNVLETANGCLLANSHGSLLKALDTFLSQPKALIAWIECCYTYSAVPRYGNLQTWGSRVLEHAEIEPAPNESTKDTEKVGNLAYELGSYLGGLDADWGHQLREKPCLIWEEATAFNPTSLLAKHGVIHVQPLQCEPPPAVVGYAPINWVSQLAPDGESDVVLSIYPSK